MTDITRLVAQAQRAQRWPHGSQWVDCAELAELYRRYTSLVSAVNVLDEALTEAERQMASRPATEAQDRERFAQAVGALR